MFEVQSKDVRYHYIVDDDKHISQVSRLVLRSRIYFLFLVSIFIMSC